MREAHPPRRHVLKKIVSKKNVIFFFFTCILGKISLISRHRTPIGWLTQSTNRRWSVTWATGGHRVWSRKCIFDLPLKHILKLKLWKIFNYIFFSFLQYGTEGFRRRALLWTPLCREASASQYDRLQKPRICCPRRLSASGDQLRPPPQTAQYHSAVMVGGISRGPSVIPPWCRDTPSLGQLCVRWGVFFQSGNRNPRKIFSGKKKSFPGEMLKNN